MKKSILIASALLTMCSAVFAQDIKTAAINSDLPMTTTEFKSVNTPDIKLEEQLKNKSGLLILFSCNTCPYVIKAQERTLEISELAKKMNINVVVVNSNEAQRAAQDSPEKMKAYAKNQGYTMPYVIDQNSQLANALGAMRTPEAFLYDSQGKLFYHGALEDNPSNPKASTEIYLANAITNLAAGVPAKPNDTKSIGCGIKRLK